MTTKAEPQSSDQAAEERAAAIAEFQRKDKWRRRLPLLPALLFTIVVTQIPFLFNIWFSLQDWKIVPPRGPDFTGLENFTEGYSNTFFLDAVGISIGMTTAAVLLSLLVGTGLALLLDRQFFGRGIARTLLITPFLIMPVVAGLLWKNQIFSSTFGVVNAVIEPLGIDAIPFVERYPFWAIVDVLVWQWSPFMMLIILAGLQGQPTDILEAARVDRASGRGIFTQITLPMLRPYMELGHRARRHLPAAGVRPHRCHDRWRAGLDERALLRLPALDRRRLGLRPGCGLLDHRGHRHDHHRHDRAARPI